MHTFIDNDLLSRLAALPIESRVPMLGNVAGKHRSPSPAPTAFTSRNSRPIPTSALISSSMPPVP